MKKGPLEIIIGLALLQFTISQSGCSLFFGNVKPVEEKSESYGFLDLSKTNPDWVRLDPKTSLEVDETSSPSPESEISDVVFQSKNAASIISLNSACKSYKTSGETLPLKTLTNELLLGISEVSYRDETPLTMEGSPALQTTIQGKLNGENMKLRTVVLQKLNCVYDLMYVARPEHFNAGEPDFSRFVSSLRLR
jgi:hypothetical protein